jgi:histone-lysine N-methyltransferase SETD3
MGLGIKASGHVRDGGEILKVPLSAVLCRATILNHASSRGAREKLALQQDDEAIIVAFLLLHRLLGDASPWGAYLRVLPASVPSALSWGPSLLNAMESAMPQFVAGVRDRQTHLRAMSAGWLRDTVGAAVDGLKTAASTQPEHNGEASMDGDMLAMSAAASRLGEVELVAGTSMQPVRWAQSLVESRALTLRGRKFLVPLADMANHKRHPEDRAQSDGEHFARHHILSRTHFTVRADRAVLPDQAVEEDYGDSSNLLYSAHHGMVIPDNPFDCLALNLPTPDPATDAAAGVKAGALSAIGIRNPPESCVRPGAPQDTLLAPETIAFLRITNRPPSAMGKKSACAKAAAAAASGSHPEDVHVHTCLGGSVARASLQDLRRISRLLPDHQTSLRGALASLRAMGRDDQHEATHVEVAAALVETQLKHAGALQDRFAAILPSGRRGASSRRQHSKQPKQAGAREDESSTEAKVARFNAWFAALQPAPSPLAVRAAVVPEFRVGVVATRRIEAEEVYLGVPPAAIMSSETARECDVLGPVLKRLRERYPRGDDFHELLFHLLYEFKVRGNESRWWPYLELLPTADETLFPAFWEEQDLATLTGLPVLDFIRESRRQVRSTYAAVKRSVLDSESVGGPDPPFKHAAFSETNYIWATAILDSRSIWWGGQRHLVPLLDLINCEEGPSAERVHATVTDSHGMAVTKADQTFLPAQQIFENYGQPNHIYFSYHGFALTGSSRHVADRPANTHDCAQVALAMPSPSSPALLDTLKRVLRPHSTAPGASVIVCLPVAASAKAVLRSPEGRRAIAVLARVNKTLTLRHLPAAEAETNAEMALAGAVEAGLRAASRHATIAADQQTLGSIHALERGGASTSDMAESVHSLPQPRRDRVISGIKLRLSQKLLLKHLLLQLRPPAQAEDMAAQAEANARSEEF